jgi:ABC-type transport system substrate-binding protein
MSNGVSNLVVALEGAPGSLDPYQSNNLYSHAVIWPICEPLFDIGRHGSDLIPRLAAAWDTDDGLTYRFHLRTDVIFHDGAPFDANAVAANLAYACNAKKVDGFRGRILRDLIDVTHITAKGHTLTVRLRYPKVELLFLALMISPDTLGTADPVGTGPFRWQQSRNDTIVLGANAEYRGGGAKLQSLTFRVLRSFAIIEELLAGRVDFVRLVDAAALPVVFERLPTLTVRPFGTYYLGFSTKVAPFTEPKVRLAFRRAIDVAKIAYDTGLTPAVGPIPRGVEAHDPDLRPRHASSNSLDTIGRAGALPLLFNQDSWSVRSLVRGLREDLAEAGVTLRLEGAGGSIDLGNRIRARRKDGQSYLFVGNWYSILPAAEIFLRPLFEGGLADNLTDYTGADGLLAKIATARSRDDRIKAYRAAQQQIVDDAPAIFLGHPRVRVSAHSARVSGLDLNVQSFPVDRFLGVDVN